MSSTPIYITIQVPFSYLVDPSPLRQERLDSVAARQLPQRAQRRLDHRGVAQPSAAVESRGHGKDAAYDSDEVVATLSVCRKDARGGIDRIDRNDAIIAWKFITCIWIQ